VAGDSLGVGSVRGAREIALELATVSLRGQQQVVSSSSSSGPCCASNLSLRWMGMLFSSPACWQVRLIFAAVCVAAWFSRESTSTRLSSQVRTSSLSPRHLRQWVEEDHDVNAWDAEAPIQPYASLERGIGSASRLLAAAASPVTTRGLVLQLDAATYPGSGNWIDSISGLQFVPYNGVTYSSLAGGGSFAFDPSKGQYMQSTAALPSLSTWSIEVWLYYTG